MKFGISKLIVLIVLLSILFNTDNFSYLLIIIIFTSDEWLSISFQNCRECVFVSVAGFCPIPILEKDNFIENCYIVLSCLVLFVSIMSILVIY